MQWLKTAAAQALQSFKYDSLFRNATYLMASTGIMSVLGFGFWIFVAHLYSPSQVGLASALISISLLISSLSLLGLNAALVRFLPASKNQSSDINAALITVAAVTAVATGIYYLSGVGGNLPAFTEHHVGRFIFLILMIAVTLNTLTDSVFIANRRAEYHTLAYASFGLIKLILPIFLVPFGSLGIFIAYIAAVIVSLVLSLYFMWRACDYRITAPPAWKFIRNSRKYTRNNYMGVLLTGLPGQLMPSLIVGRLGLSYAAYFSMAWAMANLLYVIPSATTNSLLAESSHDPTMKSRNLIHAVKILAMVLVPTVALAVVAAPFLLRLFGGQYASGGTTIFQLLAVSTFFIAVNLVGNTAMNLAQRSHRIVAVQLVVAIVTLGAAYGFMGLGLAGVGLAMLLGNASGSVAHLGYLLRDRAVARKAPRGQINEAYRSGVIAAFLKQYDLGSVEIGKDIGGGDRSITVILNSPAGKNVLKMYHVDKRTMSKVEEEIKFTTFLTERGVPVPELHPNNDGKLITAATVDGSDWVGILMAHANGEHPSNYSPAVLRSMAQMQSRIHTSGIDYAELFDGPINHLKLPRRLSAMLRWAPRGWSHFDFDGGNVLVEAEQISCVLDFEGMRYDSLVVCILFTLTNLHETIRDKNRLEIYLQAYQTGRKLALTERLIILLGLAVRFRSPAMLRLKF